MESNKISVLSGDNMVVVDAAARDRVAANGLICAYMEWFPIEKDIDGHGSIFILKRYDTAVFGHIGESRSKKLRIINP